ncbi:MAG: hypothetical protein ABNH53_02455 [Henriciella sp.]|jgi:hypothetical protein
MTVISSGKLTTLIACATLFTAAAQAQGLGDRFKNVLGEKVKDEVEDVVRGQVETPTTPITEVSAQESTSSGPDLSGPAANLVGLTKCAGLSLTNAMIGNVGTYTFQQGFSTEERTGLINRRDAAFSDGCILPSMRAHEAVYMEVDTNAYEAMGNSNDWTMQCLKSAAPSEGAVNDSEPKGEYPYKVTGVSEKDMMLHCGNSEGISECAEGSNSSRASAWSDLVESRGKTMLSVYMTASTLAPAGGEKLYCQYYNKPSGKSLFAFEYLRTPR